MHHERWRVPDRAFFILSGLVIALTVGMLVYAYPYLPERIPTHFGFSGAPDAWNAKSIWVVFFPAMIQVLLTVGLSLVYRHPRFASIPGTMLVELAPEPVRQLFWRLIRHSLAITIVLMNLLFAYVGLAIVTTGLELERGLNGWIMFGIVALLLIVQIVYSVWFYRLARQARPPLPTNAPTRPDAQ